MSNEFDELLDHANYIVRLGTPHTSELVRMAKIAHEIDAAEYARTWLPLLDKNPAVLATPFEVHDFDELDEHLELLPMLTFRLSAYRLDEDALRDARSFERVRELSLVNSPVGYEQIADFAARDDLSNITSIELEASKIKTKGVQALASSSSLTGLTTLDFARCALGDAGIRKLAASDALPSLTRLGLRQNRIGDKGVAMLAGSEFIGRLTHLDLGKNKITDAGLEDLLGSLHEPTLRELHLDRNPITDDGVVLLSRHGALSGLERLALLDVPSTDAGLDALVTSNTLPLSARVHALAYDPHSDELSKRLDDSLVAELNAPNAPGTFEMRFDNVKKHKGAYVTTRAAAVAIIRDPVMKRISSIRFAPWQLDDAMLDAFDAAEDTRALESLAFDMRVDFDDFDFERFVSLDAFAHLKTLHLGFYQITNDRLIGLARHARLPSLTLLELKNTTAEDSGIVELADSQLLSTLTHLTIKSYPQVVTPEALTTLVESPHASNLTYLDVSALGSAEAILGNVANSPSMTNLRHYSCGSSFSTVDASVSDAFVASPNLHIGLKMRKRFNELSEAALDGIRAALVSVLDEHSASGEPLDLVFERPVLGHEVLTIVANHPGPLTLRNLTLEFHTPSNDALAAFLSSPHTSALETLHLEAYSNDDGIDDATAEMIAASPALESLRSLTLARGAITRVGVEALMNTPKVARLEHLDLYRNPLEWQAWRAVRESEHASDALEFVTYR